MSRTPFLTKQQLNERFYSTVDPEAAFVTEVQVGFHPVAVARLLAAHSRGLGNAKLRVLELGASTCLFALSFLQVLAQLVLLGEAGLVAVDYTAVEFSAVALGTAGGSAVREGYVADVTEARAATPEPVTRLRREGAISTTLSLVHDEANHFVGGAEGQYDVVILNELLDDLPYRAFYADADGVRHELAAYAHDEGDVWRVKIAETAPTGGELPDVPAGTITATSAESLRLLRGIVGLLDSGGMILVHDYGFSERFANAAQYTGPQTGLPAFVELERPEADGVPVSFFRVYGNEAAHAVQITNDVNFAELADALEETGTVTTLPHGNALSAIRTFPDLFFKGDGAFVSEFINLTADDDLAALLADLHERQEWHRERYEELLGTGKTAFLSDLIYVKA